MDIYYRTPFYRPDEMRTLSESDGWYIHRPLDQRSLASRCAKHLYYHSNGINAAWPMVIALFDGKDGPEIARFMVALEEEPSFYASALPPVPTEHY